MAVAVAVRGQYTHRGVRICAVRELDVCSEGRQRGTHRSDASRSPTSRSVVPSGCRGLCVSQGSANTTAVVGNRGRNSLAQHPCSSLLGGFCPRAVSRFQCPCHTDQDGGTAANAENEHTHEFDASD